MSSIWLGVFIALIFLELATINLVSIWFAIGALASFVASLYVVNVSIQIAIFVVVSTISLLLTKKFASKIRTRKPERTNLDRVIGEVGIVTADVSKLEPGEVKVDGKRWSAVANKNIKVGSRVKILSIDGVKLHVQELKENEE